MLDIIENRMGDITIPENFSGKNTHPKSPIDNLFFVKEGKVCELFISEEDTFNVRVLDIPEEALVLHNYVSDGSVSALVLTGSSVYFVEDECHYLERRLDMAYTLADHFYAMYNSSQIIVKSLEHIGIDNEGRPRVIDIIFNSGSSQPLWKRADVIKDGRALYRTEVEVDFSKVYNVNFFSSSRNGHFTLDLHLHTDKGDRCLMIRHVSRKDDFLSYVVVAGYISATHALAATLNYKGAGAIYEGPEIRRLPLRAMSGS